jgi:hypothetical protein
MSKEADDIFSGLRVMLTIYIFTAAAVAFSLASSFLGWPVGIIHAVLLAGVFFVVNGAWYIYSELM